MPIVIQHVQLIAFIVSEERFCQTDVFKVHVTYSPNIYRILFYALLSQYLDWLKESWAIKKNKKYYFCKLSKKQSFVLSVTKKESNQSHASNTDQGTSTSASNSADI